MRVKIRLDTINDANKLVAAASKVNGKVVIEDPTGFCVNAKSLLGALHAMEFSEIWCVSDEDFYSSIQDIVIID